MAAWTIAGYLFEAIGKAIKAEPRAYEADSTESATAIIAIGCMVAANAVVPGGVARLLANHMPTFERDEEQALAAVSEAYAALRRVKQRN